MCLSRRRSLFSSSRRRLSGRRFKLFAEVHSLLSLVTFPTRAKGPEQIFLLLRESRSEVPVV